jgi:hypothetical protein
MCRCGILGSLSKEMVVGSAENCCLDAADDSCVGDSGAAGLIIQNEELPAPLA